MKWRPILFKSDSVQKIMDGTKTQTRRPVKPQPKYLSGLPCDSDGWFWEKNKNNMIHTWKTYPFMPYMVKDSPYGRPGDGLWVKETWWQRQEDGVSLYHCDGNLFFHKDSLAHRMGLGNYPVDDDTDPKIHGFIKKPSMFMPKWACRNFLLVKSVMVERVQDILPCDIQKEGCNYRYSGFDPDQAPNYEAWFKRAWEHIYPKGDYMWDSNPWVWVYEFERTEKPKNWPEV